MKTEAHRQATLEQIRMDIHRCSQPQATGDWRADALERAGELALAGRWSESREQSDLFTGRQVDEQTAQARDAWLARREAKAAKEARRLELRLASNRRGVQIGAWL